MPLSNEQESAIRNIRKWLSDTNGARIGESLGDNWMHCLQGYAGTGKTYLLAELISDLGSARFHCAAPTGKAASVLMSKLAGVEVKTLHRYLYQPIDEDVFHLRELMAKHTLNPTPELEEEIEAEKEKLLGKGPGFASKENQDIAPGDLVIVDEASMVDAELRDDLKATGCRALFVGDPGQLPPVSSAGWFIDKKPDSMLESIQRQALDNPIIRLSMDIRHGTARPRDWRKKEGCGIWKKEEVPYEDWLKVDQVITGRNVSRHKINRYFRGKLGYSSDIPNNGEKLICLKNDYDRAVQFINGTQFKSVSESEVDGQEGFFDILYEGHHLKGIPFYTHHCQATYNDKLKELPRNFRNGLMEVDFAYAITVHKSQGSEWDRVIVADDEMQKNNTDFRKRWLYTAVTRAKKELMIIQ